MKIFSILLLLVILSGCSKMEEKKNPEESATPNPHSNSTAEKNTGSDKSSSGETDEKAETLSAAADKTISDYASDKSDEAKKELITNCMAAANYLMFEATLPAREKYRPALKYYREVLAVDPDNEEATRNKNEIERIYESMGMPIPK